MESYRLYAALIIIALGVAGFSNSFTGNVVLDVDHCNGASFVMQAVMHEGNNLIIYVDNEGTVDLAFDVRIDYQDGKSVVFENAGAMESGRLGTFMVTGVGGDIERVGVQSCGMADFMGKQNIRSY